MTLAHWGECHWHASDEDIPEDCYDCCGPEDVKKGRAFMWSVHEEGDGADDDAVHYKYFKKSYSSFAYFISLFSYDDWPLVSC